MDLQTILFFILLVWSITGSLIYNRIIDRKDKLIKNLNFTINILKTQIANSDNMLEYYKQQMKRIK